MIGLTVILIGICGACFSAGWLACGIAHRRIPARRVNDDLIAMANELRAIKGLIATFGDEAQLTALDQQQRIARATCEVVKRTRLRENAKERRSEQKVAKGLLVRHTAKLFDTRR